MQNSHSFSGMDINSDDTLAVDESTQSREPLVATVIQNNLLTIQPINKGDLNPMQVNLINKEYLCIIEK